MEVVMDSVQLPPRIPDEKLTAYFERLQAIYESMDRDFGQAAVFYEFQCRGCEDSCCLTRFYHHTYLECLFVLKGLTALAPSLRNTIRTKAESVCRQSARADDQGLPVRLMCPLNQDGMCVLYHYRPMICRLHGIPHELHRPGRPVIHGPGCGEFNAKCSHKPYFKFDRTNFYFQMAALENEFRQAVGLTGRIKLTIAEMILEFGSRWCSTRASVGLMIAR